MRIDGTVEGDVRARGILEINGREHTLALEPRVLKTVVQKEDVGTVFFFEQPAGFKTVRANARVRLRTVTRSRWSTQSSRRPARRCIRG